MCQSVVLCTPDPKNNSNRLETSQSKLQENIGDAALLTPFNLR